MSNTVTIADIYKLFEKTEAQFAEFQKEADRHKEAERTMEELKKQVRETTKAVNNLITLCVIL